ncbi:MAG: TIGR02281 family clan AA aspartic protease [Dongiaceae bacterium]
MNRGGLVWLVGGALALAGLVLFLIDRFPEAVAAEGDRRRLIYLLVLLAALAVTQLPRFRAGPWRALRHAGIWIAVLFVLVAAYSLRDTLRDLGGRLAGELLPQRGVAAGDGAVSFRARDDGHFYVEAEVDGARLLFLVDTGASDVVLSRRDAARLGFDPDRLAFTQVYETANGAGRGAPVRLGAVAIGPIRLAGVAASVNEAEMTYSLLGMSFLGRLGGYDVRGDTLTLRR